MCVWSEIVDNGAVIGSSVLSTARRGQGQSRGRRLWVLWHDLEERPSNGGGCGQTLVSQESARGFCCVVVARVLLGDHAELPC